MAEDGGRRDGGGGDGGFPWAVLEWFIRILVSHTFTVMTCDGFPFRVQWQHFDALWRVCSSYGEHLFVE